MMSHYAYLLPIILLALFAVTFIDTVGAWASRKFDFNYMRLSVASFIVYILIGYLIARQDGLLMAVIVNLLVGFYDATVGLKLALILRANYRLKEEEKQYLTTHFSVISMMLISPIMAFIGYLIAR